MTKPGEFTPVYLWLCPRDGYSSAISPRGDLIYGGCPWCGGKMGRVMLRSEEVGDMPRADLHQPPRDELAAMDQSARIRALESQLAPLPAGMVLEYEANQLRNALRDWGESWPSRLSVAAMIQILTQRLADARAIALTSEDASVLMRVMDGYLKPGDTGTAELFTRLYAILRHMAKGAK